jgi:hypothetical protein
MSATSKAWMGILIAFGIGGAAFWYYLFANGLIR